MLLFLAGLQRIPAVLYEAAAVDGASRGWQTFRYITLPQLRATSAAVLVLLLINAFQAFDEFYNLLSNTGGGTYPPYARPPLVYLYYVALGRQQDFGHGSAGAVILTRAHRRVHARCRAASSASAGGVAMAEVRPDRPARPSSARSALYGVLVVAAILFLVPFYLVVRNGLSTDLELSAPDWQLFPTSLQLGNVTALFDNRAVPFLARPAQLGDRVGAADRRRRARRLDGRLRAGPHPVPLRQRRVRRHPRDADDPGGGDVRAELRDRLRDRLDQHLPRADRAGHVPGVRRLPVPPVLPRLPARAGGGGAHRRAVDVGDLLAHRRAQLQGHLRRRRLDHVHRQLERLPVAARRRQGPATSGRCRSRCRRSSTRRARG